MNVRLHIERLVLDEPMAGVDRAVLVRAVEGELARLLVETHLAADLAAGGSVPEMRGGEMREYAPDPEVLGHQVAAAVHSALMPGGQDRP